MEQGNYATAEELRSVLRLIDLLDKVRDESITNGASVSFSVQVYDANGESLGYVYLSPSGHYALHAEAEGV
jgi:hypothetical protein